MNADPSSDCLLVFTTFPDLETARQIGTTLVETQRIACVNLLSPAESIYVWKGKVEKETEIPALMKTTRAGFADLERDLRKLHPYEEPEIIATEIVAGSEGYLAWLREAVLRGCTPTKSAKF